MSMMKAALFSEFGDPAMVVTNGTAEVPEIGDDDVLIRMRLSPIHNHDLITMRGAYGVKPVLPAIGGSEATGVIAALGRKVQGLRAGMRVAVAGTGRTWAEYFAVPAARVVPVPDDMTDETAAQILGMPMGSVLALDQYDAKPGDWLVVNAANGAVGKVLAAVGKARRIRVALLVRRESAKRELEDLGFGDIFVTGAEGWQDSLREAIGPARVAGGVDMVGGAAAGEIASFISENGLFLSFGAMSNEPLILDPSVLIFRQITVRGFWSHVEFQKLAPQALQAMIWELFTLANAGKLSLPVEQVFPLAEAARAMAASARSRNGKILIAG